uniref:protein sel-1 homolog 3 n=1 Tax=Semicossyphus pulcher TaxID=241346 RepID=UPI0037E75EAE
MTPLCELWTSIHYKVLCLLCLSVQVVQGDDVMLLNPPEEAVPDYPLSILYSCYGPAVVYLDCTVSFDTGLKTTLLLRKWDCDPSGPKIKTLELNLPDWLVYQADGIVPDTQWVLSCMLEVSLAYIAYDETDEFVAADDVATLEPVPYFERPEKQHNLCLTWSTQMLHLTQHFKVKRCPVEQETVQLLSSIFASTGESFGITKTFEPYSSEVLEYLRVQAFTYPWCMFSMWIMVARHCQEKLCGLFHHIDPDDNYATPALFLSNSGKLHIQMNGEPGASTAFISPFKVPLNVWCHIRVALLIRTVTITMECMDGGQRYSVEYMFRHEIILDDTEGYFVIGGGKYIRGVEGYYGPFVFYRNSAPPESMSEAVPDVIRSVNLSGWLNSCQAFHQELHAKIGLYSLQATKPRYRGVSLAAVSRALYSLSLRKLGRARGTGVIRRVLPLLLQASCLEHNQTLYMASVLYSTGLGVKKQPYKSWLLALLAAQKDDRLALLHLGHLHQQGLHGLPADPALAYAYYANIAKQTSFDRHNPTPEQTFVEAVYLNNDKVLNVQTDKDHHLFQWLKLQARRGAAEAEQAIARMLFWGQQGVAPNIREAVRHYERGAVHWEDPASMYDYGIVLLQGQGVEKDIPKAVTFLKRAMDKDFVPAINALAWYYEQHERDYVKAVQLWEQADLLGSPDAALNLGVMHSQGLYPGKAPDQFLAYQYYLRSAERGHIRGGILLAEIWTTGLPGHVNRRPSDAVLWVKWAAEHNGYLGSILRKAMDSYLKSDMFHSLLYYMMAAESGYAAAQFNVAYLCEKNTVGFLDPAFASICMWRYYNLTIRSQNPDPYALIKLGDLFYEGQGDTKKDLFSAAQMYKQAALRKEPQGWYDLGLLVEEGYRLPLSVLIELDLSEHYMADNRSLLSTLYERCRDSEDEDSYLPCSLALFKMYFQSFQKDYNTAIKLSTAVAVVAASTIFLIIPGALRRAVQSLN